MRIDTSAGCYVIRKRDNKYELLLIHKTLPKEKTFKHIDIDKNGKETLVETKVKELYAIPKGHRKEDEKLEDAALRETTEESGYTDIEIVKPLGSKTYILPWDTVIKKTDHYFLAILQSERKTKQTLTGWDEDPGMKPVWIDLEEGFNTLTWENNPEILEKIKEYINKINTI
jgi:8-oxo-dGTP pyrophosphatase MutT (NUDIX family)